MFHYLKFFLRIIELAIKIFPTLKLFGAKDKQAR